MSVANLRARALAHNATIRWTYPVCLNDDKRAAIADAEKALKALHVKLEQTQNHKEKAEKTQRRTLGEAATPGHDAEIAGLHDKIAAAEAELEFLEQSALSESVLLRFRRLAPDEYQAAWDEAGVQTEGKANEYRLEALKDALRTRCYATAEDSDGNDLGISWDEAKTGFLNSGDFDNIGTGLILFNRTPAAVPFNQANSGLPATS